MPQNPAPEPPLAQHTADWHDEYYRRRDVLRSRYPHLDPRELHHRSLPPVANEAPTEPTPEPPKERTQAQILWPYMRS
jgi:hypothetical protein